VICFSRTSLFNFNAIKLEKYGQVIGHPGAQWGDEGKGKLIDILSAEYDIIARATAERTPGTRYIPDPVNAGTDEEIHLSSMPSGVLYPTDRLNRQRLRRHLPTFFEEVEFLKTKQHQRGRRVTSRPRPPGF